MKRLKFSFKRSRGIAHYFAHIPKTAGTSFIVLLDRFFPAEKIYPQQLWRDAGKIDVAANRKYSLFRGHFGGGGVGVLSDKPLEYFTILRNPNELALSTYQFVKRERNTKVHQLIHDKEMNFTEFLNHPMTAPLVQNRMVRNLSFDFKQDPSAQEVFLSTETIEYLKPILKSHKKPKTDVQRLHRAKRFLETCRWFGLLERFDESLQLLCFHMHWPPIGQTQKLNTHKNKTRLKQEDIAVLNKVNQQDNELYAFSLELFEQKRSQMKQSLAVYKSNENQDIDDLLDLSYQQHQSRLVPDEMINNFKYDFSQVLLGKQWHRRELMQPDNEYFRWSGPGDTASIDFWMPVQNYSISLRIINAVSAESLDQLKLMINGHEVQWQSNDTGVVRVLNVSCSRDFIQDNGLIRLTLACGVIRSHQEAFNSDDERLVGVAVHWIQFNHVS